MTTPKDLEARTVHEMPEADRDAARTAFERAHGSPVEYNLTSDRAWMEGFDYAKRAAALEAHERGVQGECPTCKGEGGWERANSSTSYSWTKCPDCTPPTEPAQDVQGVPASQFWKCGNELLPFHKNASHVSPDYRDGWNACWYALKNDTIATPSPQAERVPLSDEQIVAEFRNVGLLTYLETFTQGVEFAERAHGIVTKESST